MPFQSGVELTLACGDVFPDAATPAKGDTGRPSAVFTSTVYEQGCFQGARSGSAEGARQRRVQHMWGRRTWRVQAERKREKKQAKKLQGKEEKDRRRSEGRQTRDPAKRGAAAVIADTVIDDSVEDTEALEEERRTLEMLLVRSMRRPSSPEAAAKWQWPLADAHRRLFDVHNGTVCLCMLEPAESAMELCISVHTVHAPGGHALGGTHVLERLTTGSSCGASCGSHGAVGERRPVPHRTSCAGQFLPRAHT